MQGIDKDLRVLGKADLTSDEKKQRDHAKAAAQKARDLLRAAGGKETEALPQATEASKEVAVLVRRQLKLDDLLKAAERYRAGDARGAVRSMSDSLASDLAAPIRYIEDNPERRGVEATALEDVNDKTLAALCLLETEVAFDPRYDSADRLQYARRLLNLSDPLRLPERFVARWYIAVAGHLQGQFLLADAMWHVEDGARRFPKDADVLATAGMFYEMLALPSVDLPEKAGRQRVAPGMRVQGPTSGRFGSTNEVDVQYSTASSRSDDKTYEQLAAGKKSGLQRAEEFYRAALALDSAHAEAHLRLGRVLFLSSRADAALPELRLAAASPDRRIRYLASLFDGGVHEAAGRSDAAVAAYQEAVRTCAECLSGGIALSQLQRRNGSAEVAMATLDEAAARNAKTAFADFWWDYPLGPFWQLDSLLRELRGGVR